MNNYTLAFNQEFDRIYQNIIDTENEFVKIGYQEFFSQSLWDKIQTLSKLFTAKNEKGEFVLTEGGEEIILIRNMSKIDPWNSNIQSSPIIWQDIITIRNLFLANCIPPNNPKQDKIKIENLKLIKW